MLNLNLKILSIDLLEQYKMEFDKAVLEGFEKLHDSELSVVSSFTSAVLSLSTSAVLMSVTQD